MKVNVKWLFLTVTIFYNATFLQAFSYDDDVLDIFAKVLPRFSVMSDQKERLKNNIGICLVREDMDADEANVLAQKIRDNYPDGLATYKITLTTTSYSQLLTCKRSEILFFFNSTNENIVAGALYAKDYKALSVSYDNIYLTNGVELSLFLGRRIIPYINMQAVQNNGVKLDDLLLRISKIYQETDHR